MSAATLSRTATSSAVPLGMPKRLPASFNYRVVCPCLRFAAVAYIFVSYARAGYNADERLLSAGRPRVVHP